MNPTARKTWAILKIELQYCQPSSNISKPNSLHFPPMFNCRLCKKSNNSDDEFGRLITTMEPQILKQCLRKTTKMRKV